MNQMQKCYVCGTLGFLVDDYIVPDSTQKNNELIFVGQCSGCQRFICSNCGEKIKNKSVVVNGNIPRLIICCPFDPFIPLGKKYF